LRKATKHIDYPHTAALSFAKTSKRTGRNTMESGSHEHHRGCVCCGPSWSRRSLLAGLGAVGAASVLPAFAARAQAKPALIDTHLHFYPPEYQKLWLDYEDAHKQPHFPGQVAWTRDKLIEDMDRRGGSARPRMQ
jgi:hypothetical protein